MSVLTTCQALCLFETPPEYLLVKYFTINRNSDAMVNVLASGG
jgi:hypothetical protein